MANFKLFSDSTNDLPASMADELNVTVIPLEFHVDGNNYVNYLDGRELSSKALYDALRAGKPSGTSMVTSHRYTEAFEPVLKSGESILYLAFSSGLSGSYDQAVQAAAELNEKYSPQKVVVIDTLCASLGQGLLVWYTAKKMEDGGSIDEVADYTRNLIPSLCHWVTVDDLNHLKRGGRVSGASAVVGTLLGIKPIIHVDDDGKLIPVDKVRGRRQSLEYLANKMNDTALDLTGQTVFISHGDSLEDATALSEIIKSKMGVSDFVIHEIGPVIGSHSGPGTIALFFLGEKR